MELSTTIIGRQERQHNSEQPRWLLPFTHGVDGHAIRMAIHLAEVQGATLVPISLIIHPDEPKSSEVRLEYIQQSKDFLEIVRAIAGRFQVASEGHEVFTTDVVTCISKLIHDLRCDGVIVIVPRRSTTGKRRAALLNIDELTALVSRPPAPLILIRLAERQENRLSIGRRLLSWFFRDHGEHDGSRPVQSSAVIENAVSPQKAQEQYSG